MATLGNFTAAVLTAAELNAIGTWTGAVNLLNSGGSVHLGAVTNNGVGTIEVQAISASGSYATMTQVTTGVPFTWDVGDIITINGVYEAA